MSDNHTKYLERLCRICGMILTGRVVYNVEKFIARLENVYASKFNFDLQNIHPHNFCRSCYVTLTNVETRNPIRVCHITQTLVKLAIYL